MPAKNRLAAGNDPIGQKWVAPRRVGNNLRLRRLLCGKATPFRCTGPIHNLFRAAEGIAFAAARRGREGLGSAGKAEPFRQAAGPSPMKRRELWLTWKALAKGKLFLQPLEKLRLN